MKIVPVIKSSDLQPSLHFYTDVLEFERMWTGYEEEEMANGVLTWFATGLTYRFPSCRRSCLRLGQPCVCGRR